jgi:hypothetical protein
MSYVPRSENYQQMSSEEKKAFDEWLRGNLVLSFIWAVGLIAFAIMGGRDVAGSTQTVEASATGAPTTLLSTSSSRPAGFAVPVVDRR